MSDDSAENGKVKVQNWREWPRQQRPTKFPVPHRCLEPQLSSPSPNQIPSLTGSRRKSLQDWQLRVPDGLGRKTEFQGLPLV